jgi:hypothetical protein
MDNPMSEKIDQTDEMNEMESCPSCGALPCDWVNNPHEIWQPIETARKDGTPILLFDPEYCDEEMNPSLQGHWSDGTHEGAGGFSAAVWNNSQDYFATVEIKPTHWMPQPKMPNPKNQSSPKTRKSYDMPEDDGLWDIRT